MRIAVLGRTGIFPSLGWLEPRSSTSSTNKFVYDAQAKRVRPVTKSRGASRSRSLRWAALALALAASVIGFNATRAAAHEQPSTPANR